jgi:ActR/RegA family two-component response regulator
MSLTNNKISIIINYTTIANIVYAVKPSGVDYYGKGLNETTIFI